MISTRGNSLPARSSMLGANSGNAIIVDFIKPPERKHVLPAVECTTFLPTSFARLGGNGILRASTDADRRHTAAKDRVRQKLSVRPSRRVALIINLETRLSSLLGICCEDNERFG